MPRLLSASGCCFDRVFNCSLSEAYAGKYNNKVLPVGIGYWQEEQQAFPFFAFSRASSPSLKEKYAITVLPMISIKLI
jgi:hypothetical protein